MQRHNRFIYVIFALFLPPLISLVACECCQNWKHVFRRVSTRYWKSIEFQNVFLTLKKYWTWPKCTKHWKSVEILSGKEIKKYLSRIFLKAKHFII